jgi:hypothetical protein
LFSQNNSFSYLYVKNTLFRQTKNIFQDMF